MPSTTPVPNLPLIPTPFDGLTTETSVVQLETEEDHVKVLKVWGKTGPAVDDLKDEEGESEVKMMKVENAVLDRPSHMQYVAGTLKILPSSYVVLDASRPWLMFWTFNSLDMLDVALDRPGRQRSVSTLLSFQNPTGGFGGGPGQISHLAATYAAVSTLGLITSGSNDLGDGTGMDEVWERVDRKAMYGWMRGLKQSDGSFVMHVGGKLTLGSYCAIVVATLLNILTPELVEGCDRFISSCQTYEGGLASASHPFPSIPNPFLDPTPAANPQLGEAHGGYASCAIHAHFLLKPVASHTPSSFAHKPFDAEACLRWACEMQALPVEGGGFRGRTNKLVDGCYSWWCAGVFPVLEALLDVQAGDGQKDEANGVWEDEEDDGLFDRLALQEYILLLGQCPTGGLRDKPIRTPDAYHTNYALAGLSTAQHRHIFSRAKVQKLKDGWKACGEGRGLRGGTEGLEEMEARMKDVYAWTLGWEEVKGNKIVLGHEDNELTPIHPCFLMRTEKVKKIMDYFYGQE